MVFFRGNKSDQFFWKLILLNILTEKQTLTWFEKDYFSQIVPKFGWIHANSFSEYRTNILHNLSQGQKSAQQSMGEKMVHHVPDEKSKTVIFWLEHEI